MNDNLFPYNNPDEFIPLMHWKEEQSCEEQQDLDAAFATFGMSATEQYLLLTEVLSDITEDIVRGHVARVQAEVSELERMFAL